MTDLEKIYAEYTVGSTGFLRAINAAYSSAMDIDEDEIARIASKAKTASEFEAIWENEDWWRV